MERFIDFTSVVIDEFLFRSDCYGNPTGCNGHFDATKLSRRLPVENSTVTVRILENPLTATTVPAPYLG